MLETLSLLFGGIGSTKTIYDVIKEYFDKSKNDENDVVKSKILEELYNKNIIICPICSGFLDKTKSPCPHKDCGTELKVFGGTLGLTINEFDENKKTINDFIHEGKYIGRYSRGKTITFDI